MDKNTERKCRLHSDHVARGKKTLRPEVNSSLREKLGSVFLSWLLPGLFTDHYPTDGLGQEVFDTSKADSGLVKRCSKSHGSGWVGSDQEVVKSHGPGRVGSVCDPLTTRPP